MPLSEHEQRLLDEMERSLYRSEADVVSTSARKDLRPNYRNIVWGSLAVLIGVGGLIVGVVTQLVIVGVLGFILMFGGVFLALTRTHAGSDSNETAERATSTARDADGSISARMQRRWERRNGDSDER